MNIYAVPMLISGILCTVISIITWLFRRRENINRVFSFFTLTLAVDSYAFFAWFRYGNAENINTWMRSTFTLGFIVPIGLILFFFAFTGYDKRMDDRLLGIRVRYFRITSFVFIVALMFLSQFTNLIIDISDNPEHVWDIQFGSIGEILFTLFAGIFFYLFAMVIKGYKIADNKPQKRFILLIALGTIVWIISGYSGAIIFTASSEAWHSINYIGTTLMAIFYFVAIVNFQSDKVNELNINL